MLTAAQKRFLIAVLALLVLVHLAIALQQHGSFFTSGDQSYDDIAVHLQHGDWFTVDGRPYVENPPVYPLLVATAYEVGGRGWWSIAALQALCDLASALLLFGIARRLFGVTAALVAVAAFAVYPYAASQAAQVMDTSVFTTLLLAFVYATVRLAQERRLVDALAAGIAAGLAFLVRAPVAVVVVLLPVLVLVLRLPPRRTVVATGVAAAAALAVIAPWTIRNAVEFDALVPGAAKGGINFWKGNSPHAAEYIAAGRSVDLLTERPDAPHPPPGLDPVEEDSWWFHRGVDWARDHPRAWLHALVVKAEAFWSWNLNPTTAGDTRLKELVYTASYAPTIVLALLAVIFLRAARRSLVFLALILAAFFVVHVLTVGYTRLRAPIDPLLIALASAAAVEVVATTQRFRATRIAGARSE